MLRWVHRHLSTAQNPVRPSSLIRLIKQDAHVIQRRTSTTKGKGQRDGRNRLSAIWTPTGGIVAVDSESNHEILARAGFLRQAQSGVFHLLPLGLRVQDKIERLIDKHLSKLGASKVSLSSITSEELWVRSSRLTDAPENNSELYRLASLGQKKTGGLLLAPTHEEEITEIVAKTVKSYKELPLRLYQTSRKYRNERRPRAGLLRAREFLMNDLYTFDLNAKQALETYNLVKSTYHNIFNELKIPYVVAEADSGNMGGSLSHEFHAVSPDGEDKIISCDMCNYAANEELAQQKQNDQVMHFEQDNDGITWWRGFADRGRTEVRALFPRLRLSGSLNEKRKHSPNTINSHAVKRVVPTLDTGVEEETSGLKFAATSNSLRAAEDVSTVIYLVDKRLRKLAPQIEQMKHQVLACPDERAFLVLTEDKLGMPLDLVSIRDGDHCPKCEAGKLKVQRAIELGHTFFLGTRYSAPLNARVALPPYWVPSTTVVPHLEDANNVDNNMKEHKPELIEASRENHTTTVSLEMGCHGIGVSRMIGAVAGLLADEIGLNWPRAMAPYEVVVVSRKAYGHAAAGVYDLLTSTTPNEQPLDVLLDDRQHDIAWKLKDADLIGYPVIVVLGRDWKENLSCEVQCRRLQIREIVPDTRLRSFISALLDRL